MIKSLSDSELYCSNSVLVLGSKKRSRYGEESSLQSKRIQSLFQREVFEKPLRAERDVSWNHLLAQLREIESSKLREVVVRVEMLSLE